MQGHIFLCSNATEDECLQKKLFGYKTKVVDVNKGDIVYLYNFAAQRLHGTFVATSEARMKIDPDAWGGMFPWQVKVEEKQSHIAIKRHQFNQIIPFDKFPKATITEEQIEALEEIFSQTEVIPTKENEFRKKFPPKSIAEDGHKVRSMGELTVDNWLFHQQICHAYERKVPIPEDLYCDFSIPISDSRAYVYIEYWGLNDEVYRKRQEEKKELYKKNNLSLIELLPSDIESLDDVLPKKLRRYMPDHKFY